MSFMRELPRKRSARGSRAHKKEPSPLASGAARRYRGKSRGSPKWTFPAPMRCDRVYGSLSPGARTPTPEGDDQFPRAFARRHRTRFRVPRVGRRWQRIHRVWDGAAGGDARPRVSRGRRGPVRESLALGTNFTRPSLRTSSSAPSSSSMSSGPNMVKFTKDGSSATTAAAQVGARAHRTRACRDLRGAAILLLR